jgi:hypothetical protein
MDWGILKKAQLSELFELGLKKSNSQKKLEFERISEILEFLASLPTPEKIIALRLSASFQTWISILLEKIGRQDYPSMSSRNESSMNIWNTWYVSLKPKLTC